MTKLFTTVAIAAVLALSTFTVRTLVAEDKVAATSTAPAAMPACCGDTCKKMGANCCKADASGKVTCAMGGSCCMKPATSTAPATSMPMMPGMGGMNGMGGMGK